MGYFNPPKVDAGESRRAAMLSNTNPMERFTKLSRASQSFALGKESAQISLEKDRELLAKMKLESKTAAEREKFIKMFKAAQRGFAPISDKFEEELDRMQKHGKFKTRADMLADPMYAAAGKSLWKAVVRQASSINNKETSDRLTTLSNAWKSVGANLRQEYPGFEKFFPLEESPLSFSKLNEMMQRIFNIETGASPLKEAEKKKKDALAERTVKAEEMRSGATALNAQMNKRVIDSRLEQTDTGLSKKNTIRLTAAFKAKEKAQDHLRKLQLQLAKNDGDLTDPQKSLLDEAKQNVLMTEATIKGLISKGVKKDATPPPSPTSRTLEETLADLKTLHRQAIAEQDMVGKRKLSAYIRSVEERIEKRDAK